MMYTRELEKKVINGLSHAPAVALLGPRQVGKTTLALQIVKKQPSIYLDLENPEHLHRLGLETPAHYLDLHADKLVIIDEIQFYPNLFRSLRGVIDERRREKRGNGRFLLLGSASNKLLKQAAESLAGRIHYLELMGLNPLEIEKPSGKAVQQLWMRGGFPDSYAAADDEKSHIWRQDFIRTYLERDIPQLGSSIPAATLRRFWTMLANTQGEVLNYSKIADSLGVKGVTIRRYLDLMIDLLLVRKLEPWHRNVKKRLVKSARVYVKDSGIVHALLQIPNYEALLGHQIVGKSWEGFVIETVLNALPDGAYPFFYRTSAGAEIDLVIQFGQDECWAVEIKASRTPHPTKGFHLACEDVKATQKFVLYSGEETFPISQNTTIVSLADLIRRISNAQKNAG